MSDPTTQTQPQDIGQQISSAPEKIWKRLQAALKVETRQQAIQLVAQDEAAAEAARTILATTTEDILTKRRGSPASLLTSPRRRSPEEMLYGSPPSGRGGLTI